MGTYTHIVHLHLRVSAFYRYQQYLSTTLFNFIRDNTNVKFGRNSQPTIHLSTLFSGICSIKGHNSSIGQQKKGKYRCFFQWKLFKRNTAMGRPSGCFVTFCETDEWNPSIITCNYGVVGSFMFKEFCLSLSLSLPSYILFKYREIIEWICHSRLRQPVSTGSYRNNYRIFIKWYGYRRISYQQQTHSHWM